MIIFPLLWPKVAKNAKMMDLNFAVTSFFVYFVPKYLIQESI